MGSVEIKRARQDIEERVAQAYWNDSVIDLRETTSIIAHVTEGGVTDDELSAARELLAVAVSDAPRLESEYRAARAEVSRLQHGASTPANFEKYKDAIMHLVEIDDSLRGVYAKMGAYSLIVRKLEEHPSRESQH